MKLLEILNSFDEPLSSFDKKKQLVDRFKSLKYLTNHYQEQMDLLYNTDVLMGPGRRPDHFEISFPYHFTNTSGERISGEWYIDKDTPQERVKKIEKLIRKHYETASKLNVLRRELSKLNIRVKG